MIIYDDIINLPHHVSSTHAQMPIADRAAQFSPFAALPGYDDIISETGRFTEARIEPDENRKQEINACLQLMRDKKDPKRQVSVTYYVPDKSKSGGAYVTSVGKIKKIDDYGQYIIMDSSEKIFFSDILYIDAELST